jgi:hypothetical protein
MFLNKCNPMYNTTFVFILIIIIICIIKPKFIYNDKNEFKQFGFTSTKTIMPIYVLSFLIIIVLYGFFYKLANNKKTIISEQPNVSQQLQNLQLQMQQMVQTQLLQQQLIQMKI